MAGFGIQFQAIEILQFLNLFERVLAERRLPIKCVQNDSLQQIAKSQIVVVGKRLKHFEQALLDPNPGLDALNQKCLIVHHGYHCTKVPRINSIPKARKVLGGRAFRVLPGLLHEVDFLCRPGLLPFQ